eukprot:scaffold309594_cov22-Tisochrysis_lutea.AAC.1
MHVVRPEAPTAKGTAGAHRRKRDSLSTVPLPPWALSVVPGANAVPEPASLDHHSKRAYSLAFYETYELCPTSF